MRKSRGRTVEVRTLADFDARIRRGAESLSGWVLSGLDLAQRPLTDVHVAGALFLGCHLAPGVAADLESRGAIVFPTVPGVPVDTWRPTLYSPDELYDRPEYADTLDARAYAWSRKPGHEAALARALHDHAIDTALSAWIVGRSIVGVMGGHAAERGTPEYAEAAALGLGLAARHTVATGGGPGAMEAANLGAWLSRYGDRAVAAAVADLAAVPSFRPDVSAWADIGHRVRSRWPDGVDSLGIPTWHYGHEPSNVFAAAIAKYFGNPVREAILLQVCNAGIVFLPGAGGTVQEIFQDACENYYADASSVAPMVLVGRSYWTEQVPAWPLLTRLAEGRDMEPHVHLVDSVAEAIAIIG